MTERAEPLAMRERFLHWPLAFAEVFARERPGFDAVVGNPPWEEVNVDELGFYTRYRPGLRSLPDAARGEALSELLTDRPGLAADFAAERERIAATRTYFGPATGFPGTPGNLDLYELFCQRYQALVRSHGSLGVVLPRSAFAARGSRDFRAWLLGAAPPRRIDFLLNRRRWAFDIHPQYSVALLIADRGADRETFEVAGWPTLRPRSTPRWPRLE